MSSTDNTVTTGALSSAFAEYLDSRNALKTAKARSDIAKDKLLDAMRAADSNHVIYGTQQATIETQRRKINPPFAKVVAFAEEAMSDADGEDAFAMRGKFLETLQEATVYKDVENVKVKKVPKNK